MTRHASSYLAKHSVRYYFNIRIYCECILMGHFIVIQCIFLNHVSMPRTFNSSLGYLPNVSTKIFILWCSVDRRSTWLGLLKALACWQCVDKTSALYARWLAIPLRSSEPADAERRCVSNISGERWAIFRRDIFVGACTLYSVHMQSVYCSKFRSLGLTVIRVWRQQNC